MFVQAAMFHSDALYMQESLSSVMSFRLHIAVCKFFCNSFDLCFDDDERLLIERFIFVTTAFFLYYSHNTGNMLHHILATRFSSYHLYVLFVHICHPLLRRLPLHWFQSTPSSNFSGIAPFPWWRLVYLCTLFSSCLFTCGSPSRLGTPIIKPALYRLVLKSHFLDAVFNPLPCYRMITLGRT